MRILPDRDHKDLDHIVRIFSLIGFQFAQFFEHLSAVALRDKVEGNNTLILHYEKH